MTAKGHMKPTSWQSELNGVPGRFQVQLSEFTRRARCPSHGHGALPAPQPRPAAVERRMRLPLGLVSRVLRLLSRVCHESRGTRLLSRVAHTHTRAQTRAHPPRAFVTSPRLSPRRLGRVHLSRLGRVRLSRVRAVLIELSWQSSGNAVGSTVTRDCRRWRPGFEPCPGQAWSRNYPVDISGFHRAVVVTVTGLSLSPVAAAAGHRHSAASEADWKQQIKPSIASQFWKGRVRR